MKILTNRMYNVWLLNGRMADIEATFEDRYTKLKLVAIKLKKKTVDQVHNQTFSFHADAETK